MMVRQLVGVGVGPGDPELLTLAGQRELRAAGRVFVPVLAQHDSDNQGRAEAGTILQERQRARNQNFFAWERTRLACRLPRKVFRRQSRKCLRFQVLI